MNQPSPSMGGFYSDLFHRSKVNGIIEMDTEGSIAAINASFSAFFGYQNEDLAGKHFSVLFTEEDRQNGKPRKEIENVCRTGQADDKNFMVHKNGQVSWVSGESILIDHENGEKSVLKILQDIHQQKDAEYSLNSISDFNESILQAIDDIVVLMDTETRIIKSNPAFNRLFTGKGPQTNTDFADVSPLFDPEQKLLREMQQVIRDSVGIFRRPFSFTTQEGQRVFEISFQPVFSKNSATLFLLVGHDITTMQKTETERENLMGFVVHELRNPLTSIRLSTELLVASLKGEISNDLLVLLEKNKNQVDRLTRMIAELYDAAKVGGGEFKLSFAVFDMMACVKENIDWIISLHPATRISFKNTGIINYYGDRYRIAQVIQNYLTNAIKYSAGPIEITVNCEVVNGMIHFSVQDNGVGISGTQLPFVFDRFYRAAKTRSIDGIGLGLFLCKRIIEAHGGTVGVNSEEGKGSEFYFDLPVYSKG